MMGYGFSLFLLFDFTGLYVFLLPNPLMMGYHLHLGYQAWWFWIFIVGLANREKI